MSSVKLYEHKLSSGLRAVMEPLPHSNSLALGLLIPVGCRHELPEENGVAHFLEHMLFRGTTGKSSSLIADTMADLGAEVNAWTSREYTVLFTALLPRNLNYALDLLHEIAYCPALHEDAVETEKRVIFQEIRESEGEVESFLIEELKKTVWRDHPIGNPILGTVDSLRGIGREEIRTFHNKHYMMDGTSLVATGNIDEDHFFEACGDFFRGDFKPRGPLHAPETPVYYPSARFIAKPSLSTDFAFGLKAVGYTDSDRVACHLLSALMAGGPSGRLVREIRERQGLAYRIDTYFTEYTDTGILTVTGGTEFNVFPVVMDFIFQEFTRLCDELVDEDELRRVKTLLMSHLIISSESAVGSLNRLISQIHHLDRKVSDEEICASIESVTPEKIQKLAQRLFQKENFSIVASADFDNPELAQELLKEMIM